VNIRPVKAVKVADRRVAIEQLLHNFVLGFGVGGSGEGRKRHVQSAPQITDAKVVRPEIMPPLRDTMRLVHRNERHSDAPQHAKRRARGKTLGRDIEQFEPLIRKRLPNGLGLFFGVARRERAGFDPGSL